jgi:acetyltransferase-like isoleucine patch superfamily enzyme
MQFSGYNSIGKIATGLASIFSPPYKGRGPLARMNSKGYISPSASIFHNQLQLDENVFIGDRVIIYQASEGGAVKIGKGSKIHLGTIIETGSGGRLNIGADTHIQPRCQFSAYAGPIEIGCGVQIAPYCSFFPYDHQFLDSQSIKDQPLQSKGGIRIEDDAWIGVGAIILDNVCVGNGAVIGAGAVVTGDIPAFSIAVGNPAQVIKMRTKKFGDEPSKKELKF